MATVTVFTAERMQAIEDATVVDAAVTGGHLIFTRHDDTTFDAGGIFAPVTGTAAALATANLIYASGQLVQQTDGARLLAMGDGVTNYNSLPKYAMGDAGAYQYAYTEVYAAGVGTATVDWTGLTITFTSDGVLPIEIEAFCPFVIGQSGMTLPCEGSMYLFEGATQIAGGSSSAMQAAGTNGLASGCIVKDTRIYTAGTHTVKVCLNRSTVGGGAGNILFYAAAGFRAYIRSKLAHL